MYSCSKPRCTRCFLHRELCICPLIPELPTRTRLTIVMHAEERHKPSNTGRLAHLCLPNSEIRYRGLRDRTPLQLEDLQDEEYENWLLFLSPKSELLEPKMVEECRKPVRLLVPDGTWSQASRTGTKVAQALPGARHVRISRGRPSNYRLRGEHHPDGLATFEAIAHVMGMLEGAEVEARMEEIFRVMTERVLWTRGKIAADEVSGGIPGRGEGQ